MRSFTIALLAAGLAVGCKKAVEPDAPATITLVQGANQSIQGGKELPTPIVMRVLGDGGTPIEGVAVGFAIEIGGGRVSPGSVVSDESGEVSTKWTLGTSEPVQVLMATVPGIEPKRVEALALLPTAVVVAQGNNQTARVNMQLVNSLVIRVVGDNNVPMAGIQVAFQIASGGGVITPQSALTNNLGEVTAKWTMGAVAGANSLNVIVGNLIPQTVLATATP